jgi:predicted Ser/Thr protein kinase
VEHDGAAVVVKDFGTCAPWVRVTLGRWLVSREVRTYRLLDGHPAVPRLVAVVDEHAFAVEYRPGRHLSRRLRGALPAGFLDRLEAAVAAMHERGVVHLDLRHRDNVLVGEQGDPVLLDFASAVCVDRSGWLARALLAAGRAVDRRAVAKWRARLQG